MVAGITWNGIGFLCLYLMLKILQRVREKSQGKGIKRILTTVFIGVISGVVGVLFGVFVFDYIDTSVGVAAQNSFLFSIRLIFISVFFVSFAYVAGNTAKKFLHYSYRKEAITDVAIFIALLLILQPIAYGWFIRAWSMLHG